MKISRICRVKAIFCAPLRSLRKKFLRIDTSSGKKCGQVITVGNHNIWELLSTTGNPVFRVKTKKLCYSGGIPYSYPEHHFLCYYREGFSTLREHYITHLPRDIFEIHHLKTPPDFKPQQGVHPDFWRDYAGVPWFKNPISTKNFGEHGLDASNGNQVYGPISSEKLQLESERLDHVLNSIRKHGFQPNQYDGYPKGYFLIDSDNNWVFSLQVGFHRVAALVHLGRTQVPLQFSRNTPRYIHRNNSAMWPMVRDRVISEKNALAIFDRFFNPQHPVR